MTAGIAALLTYDENYLNEIAAKLCKRISQIWVKNLFEILGTLDESGKHELKRSLQTLEPAHQLAAVSKFMCDLRKPVSYHKGPSTHKHHLQPPFGFLGLPQNFLEF